MMASFLVETQQNPLWDPLKALCPSPSAHLKVVNLKVLKLEIPSPLYHKEAIWNDER
jgi:hypothetical protein